jgi:hypothetical protein
MNSAKEQTQNEHTEFSFTSLQQQILPKNIETTAGA